jgi:predicted RNA binding protein YcfA (HicA-like mRNA interferase family)
VTAAWGSYKARRLLTALLRIGWSIKRQHGSHRTLSKPNWPEYTFAFHDQDEIGPKMMAKDRKENRSQAKRYVAARLEAQREALERNAVLMTR